MGYGAIIDGSVPVGGYVRIVKVPVRVPSAGRQESSDAEMNTVKIFTSMRRYFFFLDNTKTQ